MSPLTGTGKLIRLILRRDRWLMPAWMVWVALIPVSFVSSYRDLYPTAADRLKYAATSGTNPTFLAMYGPLPDTSLGGIVAQRVGIIPVAVGLVALLTVIRHTRTDEQAGRREMLAATVVGRHAGLAAALIVTMTANLLVALLVGLGLSNDLPAGGAFAIGLGFAAAGCAFAAIGGVAAQLTENAGSARGIAIGALGGFFLIRLAADTGGSDNALSWLSWLSPLGWVTRLSPFAHDRFWVLALAAAFTAVAVWAAFALSARRDIGLGILPARLGPAEASPGLRTPLALAWRLHRGLLLGWLIAFVVLGGIFGGIAEGVGDLMKDNDTLRDMFARIGGQKGLIDTYLASVMGTVGLVASAYAIQAALRLRAEEEVLRAEYLLATSVSRTKWVVSHLVFSALGPVAALAVAGLTAGLVHGANTGDIGHQVPRVLGGAMIQLPAVWVLSGLTLALFGLLPRIAVAAWGALALFFMLGQFGEALQLDQSLLDLSPFTHVPRTPGGDVSVTPLAWLLAIALALTAAGLAGVRRRDVGAA
ncbi:ABC transporter permease [Actinomadura roseirufa]|uniref:ABC transporter permease n=1 Tax=Actinomadura roseirufa TaxID=2094049 RepID=UPI00104158F0|nr:ABC transporter permease [Actinomadura roseirufa]